MDGERFDTDLFIDEIEKRPSIWNMESSEYKNRMLKKSRWKEIAEIFSDCEVNVEKRKVFIYLSSYTLLHLHFIYRVDIHTLL